MYACEDSATLNVAPDPNNGVDVSPACAPALFAAPLIVAAVIAPEPSTEVIVIVASFAVVAPPKFVPTIVNVSSCT